MSTTGVGDELKTTASAGAAVNLIGGQAASTSPDDVLTLAEAAAYLKVSVDGLRADAVAARLPCRNVAGEWRFIKSAIVRWLSNFQEGGIVIAASAHPGVINKSMPKDKALNRGLLDSIGAFADDETLLPMMEQIYIDRKNSE